MYTGFGGGPPTVVYAPTAVVVKVVAAATTAFAGDAPGAMYVPPELSPKICPVVNCGVKSYGLMLFEIGTCGVASRLTLPIAPEPAPLPVIIGVVIVLLPFKVLPTLAEPLLNELPFDTTGWKNWELFE